MTIQYALTRGEIVRSYFRSLGSSPKFLSMILIYSVGLGLLSLAISGAFSRSLTTGDAIGAVACAAGAFLFMPLWLFVRGKTDKRTFSISAQGISTEIGSRKGAVPWGKVRLVENAGRHVLIVGATGNAFLIPTRAFNGPEQQAQFVQEIANWRKRG
jgi:YcxB-like protein